ncbi:MAG: hypothetical protein EAX87_04315 [Candidatus Thorarchaeota archaeon]|nr:hypothetical protein [Candidatus Thorarchaeota archaeon]
MYSGVDSTMKSIEQLDIHGHANRPLKNRFFRQSDHAQDVAILFPGLAYNSDMPLLYYSIKTMIASGINVLSLDYDYSNNSDYMAQSMRERSEWLINDVEAAFKFMSEYENQKIVCLTGKSIGTLALGHLLETHEELRDTKTIWLTPLIRNPELLEQMLTYMKDAVLVIGTKDQQYDRDIIDRLNASTQTSGIVIDGASHSLEIEGNVTDSLRVLTQIVAIIRQFLS